MSWDNNFYDNPEKYGLAIIGEIDSDEPYAFDKIVAFKRLSDGRILVGRDSGCSCPAPFEDQDVSDLREIQDFAQFERMVQEYVADRGGYFAPTSLEIASFKDKVREAF